MNNENYQPPKRTTEDSTRDLVRVILSPIPGADELLSYLWKQPFDKRVERWREVIAEALRQQASKQRINLWRLHLNEDFVSVFIQASAIAVRSHQSEKIEALKNAVLNAALPSQTKVDFYFIFVRYIDELTPTHMKLLSLLIQEETTLNKVTSYSDLYSIFIGKYPKILSQEEFKVFCGDLEIRGLVRISRDINDFEDLYQAHKLLLEETNDELPRIIVTKIAKDFISFVAKEP